MSAQQEPNQEDIMARTSDVKFNEARDLFDVSAYAGAAEKEAAEARRIITVAKIKRDGAAGATILRMNADRINEWAPLGLWTSLNRAADMIARY
jgi:hypothetical protein